MLRSVLLSSVLAVAPQYVMSDFHDFIEDAVKDTVDVIEGGIEIIEDAGREIDKAMIQPIGVAAEDTVEGALELGEEAFEGAAALTGATALIAVAGGQPVDEALESSLNQIKEGIGRVVKNQTCHGHRLKGNAGNIIGAGAVRRHRLRKRGSIVRGRDRDTSAAGSVVPRDRADGYGLTW